MARLLGILMAALFITAAYCQESAESNEESNAWRVRSVEACQKVVRKHINKAEGAMNNTLETLNKTREGMESYMKQWGDRIIAGSPSSAKSVALCLRDFANATASVVKPLEEKLKARVTDHLREQVTWYDGLIYTLFTSDDGHETVVQKVKTRMEQTNITRVLEDIEVKREMTYDQFGYQIGYRDSEIRASPLEKPIKDLQPAYEAVSSCIRNIEMPGKYAL